jgi:hypothetical protein
MQHFSRHFDEKNGLISKKFENFNFFLKLYEILIQNSIR